MDLAALIEENKALKEQLTARREEQQQTYVPKPLDISEYETRKFYIDAKHSAKRLNITMFYKTILNRYRKHLHFRLMLLQQSCDMFSESAACHYRQRKDEES